MDISQDPGSSRDQLSLDLAACLLDCAPVGILIRSESQLIWANHTLLRQIDCEYPELAAACAPGAASGTRFAGLFGDEPRIWVADRSGRSRRLDRAAADLQSASHTASYFVDSTGQAELETERDALRERNEALETQDRETGLLNRQGVFAALDRQVTRSRRYGNPLTIIRFTLNAPTESTDTTEILRELSNQFRDQLRWADEVGRVDQASFLVVLPETSEASAHGLTEKLQANAAVQHCRRKGWTTGFLVTSWRKGDDCRRLLQRVGVDA